MLELRQSDSGVLLRWVVYDDINIANLQTATVKQVKLTKPDLTQVVKNLNFETNGSDGILIYLVEDGVLNISGVYTWQIYLEVPPFKGHSDKGQLLVETII